MDNFKLINFNFEFYRKQSGNFHYLKLFRLQGPYHHYGKQPKYPYYQ